MGFPQGANSLLPRKGVSAPQVSLLPPLKLLIGMFSKKAVLVCRTRHFHQVSFQPLSKKKRQKRSGTTAKDLGRFPLVLSLGTYSIFRSSNNLSQENSKKCMGSLLFWCSLCVEIVLKLHLKGKSLLLLVLSDMEEGWCLKGTVNS